MHGVGKAGLLTRYTYRYRVFETDTFARELHRIARKGAPKILDKLRVFAYPALRDGPHGGPNIKKLKGYMPPTWRYRIGAWRFFYEIDEKNRVVSMIAVARRDRAYR